MSVAGSPDRYVVLTTILIIIAAALAFWELLGVIILAGTLAVILLPLHRRLIRVINPYISSFLIAGLVVLIVITVIGFTLSIFYSHADYVWYLIDTILTWLTALSASGLDPVGASELDEWILLQIDMVSKWATGLLYQAPMILVKIVVFLIALMAFVYKGDDIYTEIVESLPGRLSAGVKEMSQTVVGTLWAIYVVHLATALITFLLALPFFYFLGYDYVVFYATLAGLFQLVPILGPSLLMIFLGVYALSIGDIRSAMLIALVGYPIVCALPDLVFRPVIMGVRAKLNPLLMWIGFFGGLAVMGLIGFILGPLFIAFIVTGYTILIRELNMAKERENAAGMESAAGYSNKTRDEDQTGMHHEESK